MKKKKKNKKILLILIIIISICYIARTDLLNNIKLTLEKTINTILYNEEYRTLKLDSNKK